MLERPLLPKHFVKGVLEPVEALDGRVVKITMNRENYADLRKFGRDVLDIVTRHELVKTGFMAVMYNVNLYVEKGLPSEKFKVEIEQDGKETQVNWCMSCQKAVEGPFCANPLCIIEHVHES